MASCISSPFTRFVHLRALVNMSVKEVANAYMDFSAICKLHFILQSDNGREFKNSLLFNILNGNWTSTYHSWEAASS